MQITKEHRKHADKTGQTEYVKVIKLICVGRLKEPHYRQAAEEYLRRLRGDVRVEVTEVRERQDRNPEEAKRREGEEILEKTGKLRGFMKIALDRRGRQQTSEEFARLLAKGDTLFIIGGPEGLAQEILNEMDMVLSLSEMTLPHQLARVILLEQIYRGRTIMQNKPYHR